MGVVEEGFLREIKLVFSPIDVYLEEQHKLKPRPKGQECSNVKSPVYLSQGGLQFKCVSPNPKAVQDGAWKLLIFQLLPVSTK